MVKKLWRSVRKIEGKTTVIVDQGAQLQSRFDAEADKADSWRGATTQQMSQVLHQQDNMAIAALEERKAARLRREEERLRREEERPVEKAVLL